MAEVAIPFDGNPYTIQVPDDNLAEVLRPTVSQPAADLDVQIERALDNPIGQAPLKEWIKPTDRILIVSDDNTRLTPTDRIIPHLLGRLNSAGIPNSQICCIMALGTHRYMTEQEIINKVGKEICRKIRCMGRAGIEILFLFLEMSKPADDRECTPALPCSEPQLHPPIAPHRPAQPGSLQPMDCPSEPSTDAKHPAPQTGHQRDSASRPGAATAQQGKG